MRNHHTSLLAWSLGVLSLAGVAAADNPLIMDQFTADPTARFFEGKIYLYPSHDMLAARTASQGGRGRAGGAGRAPGTAAAATVAAGGAGPVPLGPGGGWFAMEDYHVFSTENLIDWKDHGVILDQKNVPWVNGAANSMWAPDCVTKDGKYFFYFPASNRIGVAIADKPEGPFKVEAQSITGGIDPCCFMDPKDGKSYLVWKGGGLAIAKLNDNMKALDGPTTQFPRYTAPGAAPDNGLIEGPFMFERKGKYYLTYPHAVRTAGYEAEQLEYAIGDSPMGPFTYGGIIMDESPAPTIITQAMKDQNAKPNGCWTNHHSLVFYKDQWILFYHDRDLSPDFDKDRSVRADYVTFNDDGSINKVIPTLRGVGIANARSKIQIDRYSAISKEGAEDLFINEKNTFEGWKVKFTDKDAWVQYNNVDFGKDGLKAVNVRSLSSTGGRLEIRVDKADGPVLATVEIGKADDWKAVNAKLNGAAPTGVHNLFVSMPAKNDVAVDWVGFE